MNATNPKPTHVSESLDKLIGQRAYSVWLDRGCPHGEDLEHWYIAKQQILTSIAQAAVENSRHSVSNEALAHFAIEKTLAAHHDDPAHRFHAPGTAHDYRQNVSAGAAPQRMRGRHLSGSLRAAQKQSKGV